MISTKKLFSAELPLTSTDIADSQSCIFQMQTTGHYWRNSLITDIGMITSSDDEKCWEEHFQLEKEADEYDMLVAFAERIESYNHLIGYNSTSFHLPYLEQKYRAYGLKSPFFGKQHTDLYIKYKALGKQMGISLKLEFLRDFLKLPEECNELEIIAAVSMLDNYKRFFEGTFDVFHAENLGEELLITLTTECLFPAPYHHRYPGYYLICDKNQAKIKIKLYDNRLRMYYPNYQDYYYLPEEDTVIHKSMASAIDKKNRIKAEPSNCYTYTAYTPAILEKKEMLKKYILTLFKSWVC